MIAKRPKNIVVCSDGTGNTTIKGRGTNDLNFMKRWIRMATKTIQN